MQPKKKILFIASWLDLEKGTGSFFIEQALILKRSFDVSVVNFKPYDSIGFIGKNTKIIRVEKVIHHDDLDLYFVEYPSFGFFEKHWCNLALNRLLSNFKKENKSFDICHAHSLFEAGFWANRLFKKCHIPYILTEHNQFSVKRVGRKKLRHLDLVLKEAKHRVVVSNDLIRQFASNGYFYDFKVIGNTFDESVFNFEERTTSKTLTIVTLGAYTPIKDFETIFKALDLIDLRSNRKLKFIWIGYNSWGSDVSEKVNALIEAHPFKNIDVEIFERLNKEQISSIFKKASIFVSSSICETFGLSVLEAMACGIPVVVTQSGGVTDFVTHKNGIIIPIKNEESMANQILYMMNNLHLYHAKPIADEAKEKYGEEAFIQQYSSLYDFES